MKNYLLGARKPTQNAENVTLQLRLATSYQAALVAIERERREAVDLLYQRAAPNEYAAHTAAEAACASAAEAVARTRTTSGDMLEPDEEMAEEKRAVAKATKEALAQARESAKIARLAWYAAKKAATPRLRKRMDWCQSGAYARNKRAYNLAATVGLAWGTRLKCGEWAERAGKAAFEEGTMPRLPRFDGGGTAAVQLQAGLSVDAAFKCEDKRFRLERVDAATWQRAQGRSNLVDRKGRPLPQPKEGGWRDRHPYALAHLRVSSDAARKPVWATWPVVISRELPIGQIKWVQAVAKKCGDRLEWQIMLTIDEAAAKPVSKIGHELAVNFGWRNLEDGALRVAYAVGSDGREEEVRVPPRYVSGVAHVDSLRSIRDRLHETAKKSLKEWLEEADEEASYSRRIASAEDANEEALYSRKPDGDAYRNLKAEGIEWLISAARYMGQWRAQRNLSMLVSQWSKKRFDGDEEIFAALEAWRKQDRHLRFWECDERAKLLRFRKDFYRCVAARWATEYARIVTADVDFRDFAELPDVADASSMQGNPQRRSRMLAAPSELRDAVKNACPGRGCAYDGKAKAAYKTQTCGACAGVMAFAAKQELVHTCPLCGARWDQDANHCRNLLASGEVAKKRATPLAPSVSDEKDSEKSKDGRWKKRRSQKASKMIENVG